MAEPDDMGGGDALLAAAIESMGVGVVILDREARVVRHNQRAERWFGAAIRDAPLETWPRLWAIPGSDGSRVPIPRDAPVLRALFDEPGCTVELVCQAGPALGTRFEVTASPLLTGTARRGAVVTFTELGAARQGDARRDDTVGPGLPASASHRIGVLLVAADDDERRQTSRMLQDGGFAVAEAGSAAEALRVAVATTQPIQVLLTDLTLDDDIGPELAHQLLQIRPRLSILYMSDHPWGALLPSRTSQRGPGLLRKPFTAEGLVLAIEQAASGDTDRGAPPSPTMGHVLLVDDEPAMRRGAADLLRDEGFEVVEAEGGRAAIDQLTIDEFDVVVSDINMPGMTGIDLLKQVRSRDIDVPVILMTALPRVDSASTAVEYGAFRYLTKPVDADELLDGVQAAIRNGRFARLRREAQAMAGHDAWRPGDAAGLDLQIENALGNLWLEYQPLIRVAGGRVAGFEALVRTGEISLRSPIALLAAADQQGRSSQVGREIRRLAARSFALAPPDTDLHVNLTLSDLDDPTLYAADAPLSAVAPRVVLELTEREAQAPGPRFEQQIRDLRAMGFRFALDDFGAGSAAMTTFSALAPEMVKLDPSLARGIHATPAKRATIAALVALCHDMRIEVVAEGVELEAERACLVDLGCDLLQGYLFARPSRDFTMPAM